MRYCTRCVMPDTKPDLLFDAENVCIACRSAAWKDTGIDWDARREELKAVLEKYRKNDPQQYDCMVPVSGGKDSTFQVIVIKYLFKMNPLCVHFEPSHPSEIGRKNLENLRNLGVDLISFKPNPHVYTKICREAFTRVGDHEWPNHVGIFTVPVQVAVRYNIPLLVWGENSQLEYGGPVESTKRNVLDRKWLEEFGGLLGLRVNDLKEIGLTEADLKPFIYPSADQLKEVGINGIFLGYYLKWDSRRQTELVKKFGFNVRPDHVEGTYVNYENLDDVLESIHDYFKYIKFGFGRASDHASLDVRNGRISRLDALKMIAKYDGRLCHEHIDIFSKRFGVSKEQFFAVVERYANKSIFKVDESGKLVWKDGQLVHLELEKELKRNNLTAKDCEDTSAIERKIDERVSEQIKKEGYVTGLIHANDIDSLLRNQ